MEPVEQHVEVQEDMDAGSNADECEGTHEDEEGSTDSEHDRQEFGIHSCLPVEGDPDWEAEELTAEEYLRRVRFEARQLPDVVTAAPSATRQPQDDAPNEQPGAQGSYAAHLQQSGQHEQHTAARIAQRPHASSRFLAADPGVPDCDPRLKPSAAWTRDFLHQFAVLRRRLHREQELVHSAAAGPASAGGGFSLLGGGAGLEAVAAEELQQLRLEPPSALMPELQQLQGLDQLQVRRQLHAAIGAAVREDVVPPEAAVTLYALSARIEKPLHAGTCALYRELLRRCAAQRAALGHAAHDARLPHLNILITVAGAYFGQDEQLAAMWDDDEE